MRIGMDEDALKERCVMNSGMDEDSYDIPASVNAIAAAETAKRTPVPVVDSTDGEALRRLAQEHTATGRPVLVRHAPLAARVASGVAIDRLSGLFSLFGKVNDNDSNFAYNIKLQAKTVFRDEMIKLAQLMALQSAGDSADLTYMGERLRYNRRGKEFHAGPGFNYKFLLMVKGKKRWDFVAPEFTPFMSSFEAEMCGIRSVFRSADDLIRSIPLSGHPRCPRCTPECTRKGWCCCSPLNGGTAPTTSPMRPSRSATSSRTRAYITSGFSAARSKGTRRRPHGVSPKTTAA